MMMQMSRMMMEQAPQDCQKQEQELNQQQTHPRTFVRCLVAVQTLHF